MNRRKESNEKPTKTSLLFPKIERDLRNLPLSAFGNLKGLFVVNVYVKKEKREEWYIHFPGDSHPSLSLVKPKIPDDLGIVAIEIEDKDLLLFLTGGLSGLQALASKKVYIHGDLELAKSLESIVVAAGGVDKVLSFIKNKSKL